ncbi:RNA ligase family protein [Endozoicomonas sp. YOMI1]|uniref:RNA ligase family protein n=1 Tax=Endozoicomonas sp. YOMI1 TaxID=2828739 RepID=UPI0021498106|nr:RNA ligase family protein [Endozoicomonas sp. YOMI1]
MPLWQWQKVQEVLWTIGSKHLPLTGTRNRHTSMADFFRFPQTPHIHWLGSGEPRGDKLLPASEVNQLLLAELTVEEKVDGANVGFSVGPDGKLKAQNRGAWIERDTGGQFKHLWRWAGRYEADLVSLLGEHLILFGEWCYARHSLAYQSLPDWFVGFDIYDRKADKFYSVPHRDELFALPGLQPIKPLATGTFSMEQLVGMLSTPSHYGAINIEGIYLRQDQGEWLKQRAKLVRSDFTQTIGEHWSRKGIVPNEIFGHR